MYLMNALLGALIGALIFIIIVLDFPFRDWFQISSFCIGYMFAYMEKFDWVLAVLFCLITSMVVFVIFDIDRPRRGFIKLDQINNAIVELKQKLSGKVSHRNLFASATDIHESVFKH